jgi:hypothetical protein
MRTPWLTTAGLAALGLLMLSTCKPRRPAPPATEISTFDILLDYDEQKGTNLAQVYRGAMERFDEYEMSKDVIQERTDTVADHIVHIFGIRHDSRVAIIRFLRNVLPFIQNPDEWIFLVEGCCEDEDLILPELYFFTGVAKELDIPTIDPIVSILSKEVTHRLTSGTQPLVTTKDIHFAVFNSIFPDQNSLHTLSEKSRARYVAVIAFYSVLPADSIEKLLEEYDTTFLAHPLHLAAARRVYAQIRNDMIDTANVLSRERMKERMPRIRKAKHVFICVGAHHLPVFDNPYELFETIHEVHIIPEGETSKQ